MLEIFSVSCVSFKEMLSRHYGKCILATYPEWNIRQVWKLNILWASSKTKSSVLLNARHREICLRYLLRFPFSFFLKALFYVFALSKYVKKCNTAVVFDEVAYEPLHLMYNQLNWKKSQRYICSMLDTSIKILQILA